MKFERMTKAEIGAYGAERRINLNEREMTKAEMIAALEKGLAAKEPATLTVTESGQDPVIVYIAGRRREIRVGQPVPIDPALMSVLDSAGIGYIKE